MTILEIVICIGLFLLITLIGLLVCFIDSKLPDNVKDKINDICNSLGNYIGIFILYLLFGVFTGGVGFVLFPFWFMYKMFTMR